ncbi:MAG: thiamine pyrophosphate-binding protein [Thalassobaculales bacterium]
MNQVSGAEALVRMLTLHGVDTVFGLCGDTSLPFYDALYRTGRQIRHVLTRDERHAAYMADAYARVTGRVGVCEGPSGGGATYILPGLVEAGESSIPVLAITSDVARSSRGRYTLTEVDQEALFRPLTGYTMLVDRAETLPRAVRAAFRSMTTGRPNSAHLGIPFDVQKAPVDEAELWADPRFGRFPALRQGPDPALVEQAAAILRAARAPVIICGGGVVIAGAEAELAQLAELIDAPVCTTISGQGSIADSHPLAVGVVGSNGGTPPTRAVVEAADCVVFVGCRAGSVTTERWRHPTPGKARIVHIDADPATIGANYAVDAPLAGDARLCLAALVQALGRPGGGAAAAHGAAARVAAARRQKAEAFAVLAASDAAPIRPERLVATLNRVMPADGVLVCDPGTPCPYFSAYFDWQVAGRHFISNRAHGALGYALAAGIGAQFGRPSAKVVSVMGDGSFGMAVGEFETVVRHRLPITFIVVSNAVYGWIKAGQRAGFGERYYSVDFGRSDHAAIAAAFGLKTWKVEDPAALEPALRQAIDHGGPSLVDVVCQPLNEARAPVSEWVA